MDSTLAEKLIMETETLGMSLVNALIFAGVTLLAFLLSRWTLKYTMRYLSRKTATTLDDRLIKASAKPLGLIVLFIGSSYTFHAFDAFLSAGLEKHFNGLIYLLCVATCAVWISRIITQFFGWYAEVVAARTESLADEEFLPLISRVSKIIVSIIALIITMKHFGQDVQSLVVSLGVGSLAIALAAQETLANMIAGFVIMTDRPFRVGDRIEFQDGKVGDIYQIGLRSTRLLTLDNTLIIVPNSEIVKERITNLSYPEPASRVVVQVGVAYSSNVEQVKSIILKCFKDHSEILAEPEPAVYLTKYGDSSLDFMAVGRVETWKMQFIVAEELRCAIFQQFRENNVEIPFPQRDLWIRTSQNTTIDDKSNPSE